MVLLRMTHNTMVPLSVEIPVAAWNSCRQGRSHGVVWGCNFPPKIDICVLVGKIGVLVDKIGILKGG